MICGRVLESGQLADVSYREPGPGDVELTAWPVGEGPFAYDPATKTAVQVEGFTPDQRAARRRLPTRLLAALAVRASSAWSGLSGARRARVQAILDAAADQALDLFE